MRSDLEMADIVRRFGKQYIERYHPSAEKLKVLFDILQCRTFTLGGHEEHCDCCTQVRYSYNSCGNRHCPKCLSTKQAVWIEQLIEQTLPVKHYHIIFTVPHKLNAVCLFDCRQKIQVRGNKSISGSSAALMVVNGFLTDDISYINPPDIVSIKLLRATTALMYGDGSGNGVIEIKTK